jgi:hypothetical protein
MMEIITTNGASILTIIALWSTVTWAVTYIYMAKKVEDKNYVIAYLDEYIEQSDTYLDVLRAEMKWDNEYMLTLENKLFDDNDSPINYYPTGK